MGCGSNPWPGCVRCLLPRTSPRLTVMAPTVVQERSDPVKVRLYSHPPPPYSRSHPIEFAIALLSELHPAPAAWCDVCLTPHSSQRHQVPVAPIPIAISLPYVHQTHCSTIAQCGLDREIRGR